MDLPVSPLAPKAFPALVPIKGVELFVGASGEYYKNRNDILLAVFAPTTQVAGVFTQSRCASAPVEWCRAHLKNHQARALLVNAGSANAFAGRRGDLATQQIATHTGEMLDCPPHEIMLAATGVIGEPLDPEPVLKVLAQITEKAPATALDAAKAIMTTDTYPKGSGASFTIDDEVVHIAGIAKGSGMIAPDMATMLSFVFTDMAIDGKILQSILAERIKTSFNAITVDSDTSTSDTCLVFATGSAKKYGVAPIISMQDARLPVFSRALDDVLFDLAMQVVRDGEGATKFVEISVSGAISDHSAQQIARSVANSPLVKTAISGEDANWGRVVMAVGKAGEPANRDLLTISFGDLIVARNGERSPDYDEKAASAYMKNQELEIRIDLGLGHGKGRIYTCDLSHGYISINGDYRS
ncbi:Glutamate N-acetyltransferase @ N-acetylglutamate synthase [hydrothermal vent metagenome]|uniref:Glutamate N-acetyltransferase @ N-acetylglutamate synthase n=1 Tax=hydrothermal vent metagenome TaxID=652676 RepID=A0A3B0TJV9_9ZZZZ